MPCTGRDQLEKCHCRVNGDSLLLSPGIMLLKEGQVHQAGAVLPRIGGREGHVLLAAHPLAAHTPLSKIRGGGLAMWPRPAWSCHCWSKRERAARDKELSLSSNRRQGQTGRGGSGKPQGGQSCRQPDRTRPRATKPVGASWSEWPRAL